MNDDDLWFLPPDFEVQDDKPRRVALAQKKDHWSEAQSQYSRELSDLSFLQGQYEAFSFKNSGVRNRIALRCLSQILWWAGIYIPVERIILWKELQLTPNADEQTAYDSAAWAQTRLLGFSKPADASLSQVIRVIIDQDTGNDFELPSPLIELEHCTQLTSITQAASVLKLWRQCHDASLRTDVLAATLAAIIGARTPGFVMPIGLSGVLALRSSGAEDQYLGQWIQGLTQDYQTALAWIDRHDVWQRNAVKCCADQRGDTPLRVVQFAAEQGYVTVASVQSSLAIGRATAQRQLDWLQRRNVLREITGQDRYRIWTPMC
jgi:hypothetical protein